MFSGCVTPIVVVVAASASAAVSWSFAIKADALQLTHRYTHGDREAAEQPRVREQLQRERTNIERVPRRVATCMKSVAVVFVCAPIVFALFSFLTFR